MSIAVFRDFVRDLTELADKNPGESAMLAQARPLLHDLLARDVWLPDMFAAPSEERYRQYLLHCDPLERFSIVSFVWGPGQHTPIHDHIVWGLLGVLRGSEVSQRYVAGQGAMHVDGAADVLEAGASDMVSPAIGDIHQVRNGSRSHAAVSIHVYGGNIGAIDRHVFLPDGEIRPFRSDYSLNVTPNIW